MKKLVLSQFSLLLAVSIFFAVRINAQAPGKMSYQAVIRNSSNQLVINTKVGMRISILQGSATGTAVYTETQIPTTNANGLVAIAFGGGAGFDAINWENGPYFLKTETDPSGSTNYTITGTSQLLSVPYALYSQTTKNAVTLADNQAITGNKTFSGTTTVVNPTNATDAANKDYVDNTISSKAVTLNTNQTITSNKSFTGTITVVNPTNTTDVANKQYVDNTISSNSVTLAGNQTVAGNKTFTGTTTVSNPVNNTDAVNKQYVDNIIAYLRSLPVDVTDYDGNHYGAVLIGGQLWLNQNLKTTHFMDGSAVPNVTSGATWTALTTNAYCWYNNDIANKPIYGALYNYYATVDSRNLCPTGWHVPSLAELHTLNVYLAGQGGKLKETGTTHWTTPNTGATNETGFMALPGGLRMGDGSFFGITNEAYFGSTTATTGPVSSWYIYLRYDNTNIQEIGSNETNGYSVRCLKD